MLQQETKKESRHICSNNKKWFDQQVALWVAKGWTIESQHEDRGFYHAILVWKE